jgi:integrase
MARPKLDTPNFKLIKRGDAYYVRWWEDGQWKRVSTREKGQSEARRFLINFAAGHATPEPPAAATIGQILDGYLADRKETVRAYGTLEAAANAIRRHLGELQATSLTRERGKLYAKKRRAEGHEVGKADAKRRKPTSDGTILREIVTLRAALKWAVQEKWLTVAPYVPAPAAPQPRDRWLTRDEFVALVNGAATPHIKLFILLALHTGARSGAILELTWPSIDLERGLIHLGTGTGNKGRAVVPINDELRIALKEAREGATKPPVIQHGSEAVKSIKTAFKAACRRAKLEGVTPHTLRHTAATWMAMDGVPLAEISRYLGHSSEKLTETVYAKHTPEYLRRASDSLTARPKAGQLAPKTQS